MSQKPLNQWTGQEMPKLTLDKLKSFLMAMGVEPRLEI